MLKDRLALKAVNVFSSFKRTQILQEYERLKTLKHTMQKHPPGPRGRGPGPRGGGGGRGGRGGRGQRRS